MSCYICQKGNCRFYACRYCGESSCSAVCTKTHRDVASACEDIFTKASGMPGDLLSPSAMSAASGGTEVAAAAVMNGLAEALEVSIQTLCPVLLRDALIKRCSEEGSALPEDHPLRMVLQLASSAAAVAEHGSTQSSAAPSTSQEVSQGKEAIKKEEGVGQERGRGHHHNNNTGSGSRPAAIAGQKRGRLQRDDQLEGSSPSSVQEEEDQDLEEEGEETASTPPPPPPPCPSASDGDQQEEKATGTTANAAAAGGGGGHPEEYILGRREIDALVKNRGIRSSLKSGELQRLIQQIDGSASKLSALETAMKHNPDFKEFCETVLDTIWSARQ